MTSVVEQRNVYAAQFAERRQANEPLWLQQIRENAIQRFAELGFPTTRDEDWRFTSAAPIARVHWGTAPAAAVSSEQIDAALLPGDGVCRLVFVNGSFAPELSGGERSKGIVAGSLASALTTQAEGVYAHLARSATFDHRAFAAWNTAFFADGAFVRIGKGVIAEQPIHLVFVSSGNAFAAHPRNLILVGEASQATIIESYIGLGSGEYLTNAVTEIVSEDAAVVDHYKVQRESESAFHVASLQTTLGRRGSFASHSISLGGALVRNDANATLAEGSECTLNGLYLVTGRQHVDNHTAMDHAQPHGTSHELYKGILDGHAAAVFNGKILVRKDAQKTDAKQTNKNLVLSEDAVIDTKPELQIYADDVRCTHGATIGQLDAEAMFYLQSRGIGRKEARDLLIMAFARDIIDRVKVQPLRERLERMVYEKLHEHRD